jgi:acyl phosphate:glycerol-3-phosphate acyltransferase
MPVWLALVGAYVIGSLDFAVVVARSRGVDIRSVGSGNPGMSNVLRTLGRGPAVMVLVGDMMKGVIAAALGYVAANAGSSTGLTDLADEPLAYAAGLLAVTGHVFPVFHRFRGGKGVATGGGVLLFTIPWVALTLAVTWFVVARLLKVASVASLVAVAATLPLAYAFGARGWSLVWLGVIIVLILWRHLPNIRRMISGSEEKVPT